MVSSWLEHSLICLSFGGRGGRSGPWTGRVLVLDPAPSWMVSLPNLFLERLRVVRLERCWIGPRDPLISLLFSQLRDFMLIREESLSGRRRSLLFDMSKVRRFVSSNTFSGRLARLCSLRERTPVLDAVSVF